METNHLKNAISGLPELEAPDIWNQIEKQLPRTGSNRIIVWTGTVIIVLFGLLAVWQLQSSDENRSGISVLPLNNSPDPVMRYANVQPNATEPAVMERFTQYNTTLATKESTDNVMVVSPTEISLPIDSPPPRKTAPTFTQVIMPEPTYVEIGENLVINGDFEDFNICPSGFTERRIKKLIPSWEVPSKGTPDYFNACSKSNAGVPNNFAGRVYAKSGYGYAGLILRESFTKENKITGTKPLDYREYIITELKQPLVKGKTYRIRFWVCNSSKSRYAVDAVGALLTNDKIRVNHNNVLDYTPAIKNARSNFLTNQTFWVAVEGVYKANGGERFLTVGNFNYNQSTLYVLQNANAEFNYAYYYIDDVSVIEVVEKYESVLYRNIQSTNDSVGISKNEYQHLESTNNSLGLALKEF